MGVRTFTRSRATSYCGGVAMMCFPWLRDEGIDRATNRDGDRRHGRDSRWFRGGKGPEGLGGRWRAATLPDFLQSTTPGLARHPEQPASPGRVSYTLVNVIDRS
jgi:hypothetical protein